MSTSIDSDQPTRRIPGQKKEEEHHHQNNNMAMAIKDTNIAMQQLGHHSTMIFQKV